MLQQHLPFTVLKPLKKSYLSLQASVLQQHLPFTVLKRLAIDRNSYFVPKLQQHLLFTVCAAGCRTAEEQSDDEVHTS